jgi:hypothetical protein
MNEPRMNPQEPVVPMVPRILVPGTYLIELEFSGAIPEATLKDALSRMMFEDVVVDQQTADRPNKLQATPLVPDLWGRWREWGHAYGLTPPDGPVRYRFAARLRSSLQTVDTPLVRWVLTHACPFDALTERSEIDASEGCCFGQELLSGRTYAVRFSARMRSQEKRFQVVEALALMGFRPHKIMMLKKNMRVPGIPNASTSRWYGILRWEGEDNVLVDSDPLFFEDVVELPTDEAPGGVVG